MQMRSGPAMEQKDLRWSPSSTGTAVTGYPGKAADSWQRPSCGGGGGGDKFGMDLVKGSQLTYLVGPA